MANKKVLDIRKTFNKKALIFSKEKLIKDVLSRDDVTLYLDKESHWNNGESEFILTIHIKNNFT